jgi:hypothetical protein
MLLLGPVSVCFARKKLYSNFGLLYPHGHNELSIAEDFDQIRAAMEKVPAYAGVFNKVGFQVCRQATACVVTRLVAEQAA